MVGAEHVRQNAVVSDARDHRGGTVRVRIDPGLSPDGVARSSHLENQFPQMTILDAVAKGDGSLELIVDLGGARAKQLGGLDFGFGGGSR